MLVPIISSTEQLPLLQNLGFMSSLPALKTRELTYETHTSTREEKGITV
jgi:hypothetical protein